MGWSKAKALAEKVALGELSLDSIGTVMEEAIAYGRTQERAAALRRINAGYAKGVFSDELTSGEILNGVRELIRG